MMHVRSKIEMLDLREMETSLKLVGSQTLIYCSDIFGELDMSGCSIIARMAETEGITRGQSAWGADYYLTYGLIPNLMSNVIALRISDKVRPSLHVCVAKIAIRNSNLEILLKRISKGW